MAKPVPVMQSNNDVFAVCRYYGPGTTVKTSSIITDVKNMDVNGDDTPDLVGAIKNEAWVCPDQYVSAPSYQLIKLQKNDDTPLLLKKNDGAVIKVGDDVVDYEGKNYIVIGPIEKQPIFSTDGKAIDRDKLIVIIVSVEALKAINNTKELKQKIERLMAGVIKIELGKLKKGQTNVDLEKLKETIATLDTAISQAAKDQRQDHDKTNTKSTSMAAKTAPGNGMFSICRFLDPGTVIKIDTTSVVNKTDINGDGLEDYVAQTKVENLTCPGEHLEEVLNIAMGFSSLQKDAPLILKKNDGSELHLGDLVIKGERKYILIELFPQQQVFFEKNKINRDKLAILLLDIENLQAASREDLSPDQRFQKIISGGSIAELSDIKKDSLGLDLYKDAEKCKIALAHLNSAFDQSKEMFNMFVKGAMANTSSERKEK